LLSPFTSFSRFSVAGLALGAASRVFCRLDGDVGGAAVGGLAILKMGDKVRIDLNKGTANILISDTELKQRRAELKAKGGFPYPANQTPWQELYRSTVGQQATGACMEFATRYHDIAGRVGVARDNH